MFPALPHFDVVWQLQKFPHGPVNGTWRRMLKYTCIDFNLELSNGKTWIDIGCRTGKAMRETKRLYKARLIGVNAHRIKTFAGIESIFAEIPQDFSVYKKFRKHL
jgi:hypothetical protein